ncbi:hypothetical protein I3760_02G104700 [Carya illinoinensis]|nr:hypothetical protein I3760_02G104700 [Carya illinoinensis]
MSEPEKVSSSASSSELTIHSLRKNPMCTCGSPASLRTSKTPRNPGRAFFGCSKYNKKGLPHCDYFKWADSDQASENELMNIFGEMCRKEEELRKVQVELRKFEEEVRKREEEVRKREEEVRTWMEEARTWMEEVRKIHGEIVKRDSGVQCERPHLRIYWAIPILLYLYLTRSQ